jgi:hypothetical protein
MGVFGIFLLVFGYVIYKAMTHNPEKLAEERFEEYRNEIAAPSETHEDDEHNERAGKASRGAFGLSCFTIAAIIFTVAVLSLIVIYYEPA